MNTSFILQLQKLSSEEPFHAVVDRFQRPGPKRDQLAVN